MKTRTVKDDRVHVRLPSSLKAWVVDYASERHITVSTLVVQLLTDLQATEQNRQQVDAEQV